METVTLAVPEALAELLRQPERRAEAVEALLTHFADDLVPVEPPAPPVEEEAPPSAGGKSFDPDAVRRRMSQLLGPLSSDR